MPLLVDSRERAVIPYLASYAPTKVIPNMKVGDFNITSIQDSIEWCIERKTLADWALSIADGRMMNKMKMIDLRRITGCQIMYIIEGEELKETDTIPGAKHFTYKSVKTSSMHLRTQFGIHIEYTRDPKSTAKLLIDLSLSCLERPTFKFNKLDIMTPVKIKNQWFVLYPVHEPIILPEDTTTNTSAADILDVAANAPSEELVTAKKSLDILEQKIQALRNVQGIGPALAEALSKYKMSELLSGAIVPSEIKLSSGRAISDAHIKVINGLCESNVTPSQIKFLSGITFVSEKKAVSLLRDHGSLKKMCDSDKIPSIVKSVLNA